MRWRCTKCGIILDLPDAPFVIHCGIRHDFPLGVVGSVPTLLRRAANFARAGAQHVLSGSKYVDDATRQWRLEQCLACTQFYDPEKETCTHPRCGCGIKKQRGIIDKLGWASQRCPIDRWKYAPITVRNLIYHVCPLATNDGWRQNVRQLLKRFDVFNGRRIIAIARGEGLEWEQVHSEFQGEDYEFFYVDNDANLREVASFLPLLEQVQNVNRDEATFYAHTKGNSTFANMQGAIRWRNAMYRHLLETDLQRAMALLQDHVFVGCHKMVWGDRKPPYPSGLDYGRWFLAGTFFWFRNDTVFGGGKWRTVPNDRYGAEAWPAGIVDDFAAASVYQKFPEGQTYTRIDNPYNPALYEGEDLDDPA
jgi:hypothetical protein